MADKTLLPEGLSGDASTSAASDRRRFLRRAVGVGIPVVLATVRGRSVLAQNTTENGSGCMSMHPSGWLSEDNPNYQARFDACQQWEEAQEPEFDGLKKNHGRLFDEPADEAPKKNHGR
jgi:hypothetical protein